MTDTPQRPADFNPWLAADALKGLSEAMHWFITEGPAADEPMSRGAHASMIGLSWTAQRLAHELHAYLAALSEAGIELPTFGNRDERSVQESAAEYALN